MERKGKKICTAMMERYCNLNTLKTRFRAGTMYCELSERLRMFLYIYNFLYQTSLRKMGSVSRDRVIIIEKLTVALNEDD